MGVNDIWDSLGNTILHSAARYGNNEMVVKLLDYGADVKAKNNAGQTAVDVSHGVNYDLRNAISTILDDSQREFALNRWREEHGKKKSTGGFVSRMAGSFVCGASRGAGR